MMARVADNGTASEVFAIINGMKQGCVFVPILFNFIFSAILMDAYRYKRPEYASTGADGPLLNSRCMQAPTRLSTNTVPDLRFVEDCALNITTEVDMQRGMDPTVSSCANCGLTVNTDKTAVMLQPPLNQAYAQRIHIDGTQLKTVANLVNSGSILSPCIRIDGRLSSPNSV
ncbi:hypothetical protein SprV_0301071700 [Sparganum proliferum]